jgi:four helix bundle protein
MIRKYHVKFEDLQVYQKAMDFGEEVNRRIDAFSKQEAYSLGSRFIRAADSIALNIAERSGSTSKNDSLI